jgi:hypothetical protein
MKQGKREEGRPVVVVQWIEVIWDKLARGAEQATKRNALPTAYPLPELVLKPETEIVVQRLYALSDSNFECEHHGTNQYPSLFSGDLPAVDLEVVQNQLLLNPRTLFVDIHRPQMIVPQGHWSRLIWNERVVSDHTTRFAQSTLNIGYFLNPNRTVFLDQGPLAERSDLQYLY